MFFKTIAFLLLTFLLPSGLFTDEAKPSKPLSVLIIGGGPAGLATAIEAKQAGATVTLVEKREQYSRPQVLFLLDSSLQLFKKWQVSLPQMRSTTLEDNTQIGFVKINHLEESLAARVNALGIQRIRGEFTNFDDHQIATVITPEQKTLHLPYDIIVAADGAHSLVRKSLSINMHTLGSAVGAFALIIDPTDTSSEMDISEPIKKGNTFVRRIKVPSVSILFTQSPHSSPKEELQHLAAECGWEKESQCIAQNKAFTSTDIPITLQQAHTFSSQEKSVIIVGDAAGTASFFQGMGANTALITASIAGQFFQNMQQNSPLTYQDFNQAMREATDSMIEDSAFLFPKSPPK